jgi:hypothetical protein
LKNLEWKSNFSNVLSLIIIIFFLFNFVYVQIFLWYETTFSFLQIDDENIKELINFTFNSLFSYKSAYFKNLFFLNNLLTQTLIDVFSYYSC